eukprot:m.150566 g.150566  ORF g.150566 m.150566 type:complete len:98 (+) comp14264_c0_seq16:1237-1530(+)
MMLQATAVHQRPEWNQHGRDQMTAPIETIVNQTQLTDCDSLVSLAIISLTRGSQKEPKTAIGNNSAERTLCKYRAASTPNLGNDPCQHGCAFERLEC